jgi:hypothetical protein
MEKVTGRLLSSSLHRHSLAASTLIDTSYAGPTCNANAQNTRAGSWRDETENNVSHIPQMRVNSRLSSNSSQLYNLAPAASVPAEGLRQLSHSPYQGSPILHSQQLHPTEIPSHHDNEHGTVAGNQEAISSLGDTDLETTDTAKAINQETGIEPDNLEILPKLQQNIQDRITRKRQIETDRIALPEISALKARVEGAETRHAEQIRIAEKAERLVMAVGSELKDALAKERQIAGDEQGLEQLIETSTVSQIRLGIDD